MTEFAEDAMRLTGQVQSFEQHPLMPLGVILDASIDDRLESDRLQARGVDSGRFSLE
jgi:hypothetical protein